MNAHIPPNQDADDDVAVDYETLDNGMDEILDNGMEGEEELQEANKCRKNTARIVLALIVVGFIIYIIVDSQGANNVKRLTQDFLQWVEDNPAEGVFAFVGVYIIATVLFIPGSILTLGAESRFLEPLFRY
jgi:pheromone shutdown protein TraB